MKKLASLKKIMPVALSLAFPLISAAATVTSALEQIRQILNVVIGLLFVVVTLYFIWGVIKYVMAGGDEKKIADGKQHMIWGIVGMAVMAAAWGIVRLIIDTFGVGGGTIPTGPGM